MKIDLLEHLEIRSNIPAAVETAQSDVDAGRTAVDNAEAALAVAVAERDRIASIIAEKQAAIATATAQQRAAKESALGSVASGADASKLWAAYNKLTADRERLTSELQYIGSWNAEDAERGVLLATLARHVAMADQFENQASLCRLKMLLDVGAALENDPGCSINVEHAFSTKAMAESSKTRADLIPLLEKQIARHDERVTAERETLSMKLFN